MSEVRRKVENFLDSLLFVLVATILSLAVSAAAVCGIAWVLNFQLSHPAIVILCLISCTALQLAVLGNSDLIPTGSRHPRFSCVRLLTQLVVGYVFLVAMGILLFIAFQMCDLLSNRLLTATDGPGHLAILRGLEIDHTDGFYPYLVFSDGTSARSPSPYPVGSHFLAMVIGAIFRIDIAIAYEVIVTAFEFIVFPLALISLFRVTTERVLPIRWILLVFSAGVCYRPFAEAFQGPTVIGTSLAIVASSTLQRIEGRRSQIPLLILLSATLLLVHPSGFFLFLLIVGRLKRKSIIYSYLPLLLIVGFFYVGTVRVLRTGGYFTSWVSSNQSALVLWELSMGEIPVRVGRFVIQYFLGMGRYEFLPIALTLFIVSVSAYRFTPSNIVECCFSLCLLATTSLTGLTGVGPAIGLLTFPWYGTPDRFVVLWTVTFLITVADSRQLPTKSHARN